jgi:hypothetical protein
VEEGKDGGEVRVGGGKKANGTGEKGRGGRGTRGLGLGEGVSGMNADGVL